MLPHPLSTFEIQKYQNELNRLYGVFSRNNLSQIKDGAYMINLNGYESIGTYWIALYANAENVAHFDSFGVEHIQKFRQYS